MGGNLSNTSIDFIVAFSVLQFVALIVLSVISYFLKHSLGNLDAVENKVETIQREAAMRTNLEVVDSKIDKLRDDFDEQIEGLKDTVNLRFDGLKETLFEKIGSLNTQVAVIIDRDRMRRVDDYESKGLSRRQKPIRDREGEI